MGTPVAPPIVNPQGQTPNYADRHTPTPRLRSHFSRWRIARAGGVGSACGMIMSEGLLGHDSIFHKPWSEILPFLFSVGIMVFVGFALIEPFLIWLEHGTFEHHQRSKKTWPQKIGLLAIVLGLSLLFTVFEDLHRETLLHRHLLMGWVVSMLVGWMVTFAWVLGAQHGVPRATIYGVLVSLGIGVASSVLIILSIILGAMSENNTLTFAVALQRLIPFIIMLAARNVGGWTLYGLVGGLAIDFGRGLPASVRVLVALVATALVTALANPIIVDENSVIFADVFRVMGWGLALVMYPPANLAFAEARIRKPAWWSCGIAVALAFFVAATIALASWLTALWQHDRFYGAVAAFGSHSAPVALIHPVDDDTLATAAFSRGGQTLDTTDLSIRLWNLSAAAEGGENAEKRRLFAYNPPLAANEPSSHVMFMQLSDLYTPHEHQRIWSASIDCSLTAWDTERCVPLYQEKFQLPDVPTEKLRPDAKQTAIRSAAQAVFIRFRHDGRQIAVADDYNRLHLYSVDEQFGNPRAALTIKYEATLDIPGQWVTSLRYNHEGSHVIVGTSDGEVAVAEINSEKKTIEALHNTLLMPAERKRINDVAMSDDETLVAAASEDGFIYVWNLKKGKMWPPLAGHDAPVTGVAFTPDGRHLASVAMNEAKAFMIWDCLTNAEVYVGEQTGGASTVTIFADGTRAASGSPSGSVRVWRIPRF